MSYQYTPVFTKQDLEELDSIMISRCGKETIELYDERGGKVFLTNPTIQDDYKESIFDFISNALSASRERLGI